MSTFRCFAIGLVVVVATGLSAIPTWAQSHPNGEQAQVQDSVPRFSGLGSLRRTVTTKSPAAQEYFNQGLAFLYAFNHDEANRSFQQATKEDPDCAMAWWGIAMANGPHINKPVVSAEQAEAACRALEKACQIIGSAATRGPSAVDRVTAVEADLICAATTRYANPQPEDRKPLDEAFAAAMRYVWKKHPSDPDVGAIFAESMMDLRPWDLWTPDGHAQPGTEEVVQTLETVMEMAPQHPLALHLYIHAVEASPKPERAVAPADRLRDLQPGLGHMVHMPSHIDVRLGNWEAAIVANQKAIAADDAYQKISPKQGFYRIYMAHNRHMLGFAAIMIGRSRLATDMINEMAAGMPSDWIKENAALADGFTAVPLEVMVRFGKWDEILKAPEPPDYLPIARSLWHKSRAIAYATKGDLESALREQEAFSAARKTVPEEGVVGNNKAADILAVAEQLMAGEILYRQGKVEEAVAALRRGVELEDKLKYAEPPDWLNPVRHALGAVLLQESRGADAESVFRADLAIHPHNGWALFGLARSLELQNRADAAAQVRAEFETVWRGADIEIKSPCLCVPGK